MNLSAHSDASDPALPHRPRGQLAGLLLSQRKHERAERNRGRAGRVAVRHSDVRVVDVLRDEIARRFSWLRVGKGMVVVFSALLVVFLAGPLIAPSLFAWSPFADDRRLPCTGPNCGRPKAIPGGAKQAPEQLLKPKTLQDEVRALNRGAPLTPELLDRITAEQERRRTAHGPGN